MLGAIHALERLDASTEKADAAVLSLEDMRLAAAVKCVREGVVEALTCTLFPMQLWRSICANDAIERLNREIRRRTRVVGAFSNDELALMPVVASERIVCRKLV